MSGDDTDDIWSNLISDRLSGEKKLIFAVIIRALADLFSRRDRSQDYKEAHRWISGDGDDPWGYHWCCAEVSISNHNRDLFRHVALHPSADIDVCGMIRGAFSSSVGVQTRAHRDKLAANARASREKQKNNIQNAKQAAYLFRKCGGKTPKY